ncbi:hypothetical protein Trydic_g9675 [Trypoxylus dichotomus]
MQKEGYSKMLGSNALPSEIHIIRQPFIVQQGKDPKLGYVRSFLEENEAASKVTIMVWSPRNPNLYPIQLCGTSWTETRHKMLSSFGATYKKVCLKQIAITLKN